MPATTSKSARKKRRTKRISAERARIIDELCGKYRHLGLSSEQFAREKRAEIEREDRVR